MEGIRDEVLPPNQKDFDEYFTFAWTFIHTLTAAATALKPELGTTSDLDRFKPYLEAEEARLAANLTAVDYVIDGVDTLTLITGVGRIEKVCAQETHPLIRSSHLKWRSADCLSSDLSALEASLRNHAGHEDEGLGLA